MSIINTFDLDKSAIINPTDIHKPIPNFPEVVVVTFSDYMTGILLKQNKCEKIKVFDHGFDLYTTTYKNKAIALFRSPIGAAATVAFLEETIAFGAKKILLFGTCGTLDTNVTKGSIIVPTHAYRDEGVSYHYMSADLGEFVEVKTADTTKKLLEEMGIPVVMGKTWTTDAIFRETKRNMQLRKNKGCIVVEMECAGVMAMAQFRDVPAYQFVFADDNLDSEKWESWSLGKAANANENYAKIAIELAAKI